MGIINKKFIEKSLLKKVADYWVDFQNKTGITKEVVEKNAEQLL